MTCNPNPKKTARSRTERDCRRQPFFVIGTQRSGTTLLSQILNMHPNLYCLNELSAVEDRNGLWDIYETLNETPDNSAQFETVLMNRLALTEPYLPSLEADRSTVIEHVDKALRKKAKSLSKARWGIKDPRLTYFAETFYQRYPNAKFILIMRDPRAVCHSHTKQKENIANIFYGAQLWVEEIGRQREFVEAHPASCLCLRYEDLLANPEAELRRIMNFLGERYTDDLLKYHEVPAGIEIHNGNVNVTRPLDHTLASKWRDALSERQLGIIQAIAGDLMHSFGYKSTSVRKLPGSLTRFGYSIHQWVLINYWWQRRSRLYGLRKRLRWPRQLVNASYAWILRNVQQSQRR